MVKLTLKKLYFSIKKIKNKLKIDTLKLRREKLFEAKLKRSSKKSDTLQKQPLK